MKRKWETDELVEYWSLTDSEMELVRRKKGVNRLGMALLLKFFQHEGRFPSQKNEIPRSVQRFVAEQLSVPISHYQAYDWNSRAAKYQRTEIRELLGFRQATETNSSESRQWLIKTLMSQESDVPRLKRALYPS